MPTRIYHIAVTLFFVLALAALSLAGLRAAPGAVTVSGLHLFPQGGFAWEFFSSMETIGMSFEARRTVMGLVAALNAGSAVLLVFAMMFLALGQPREQLESRSIYQVAASMCALAAAVTAVFGIVTGAPGTYAALQVTAVVGLAVALSTFDYGTGRQVPAETAEKIVAGSAARQAAFTAHLVSLAGRRLKR